MSNNLVRRLVESKEQLDEKSVPKPVIVDSRPVEFYRCPHCQNEIHEKGTYVKEGVDYHRECQGAIQYPPTDWSKVSPEWRAVLEPRAAGK